VSRAASFKEAPGAARLAAGIAIAQAGLGLTFRGPRPRFWQRMTLTGLGLGSYALAVSRPARRVTIGPAEVALGIASAAVLYATFQLGDRFARRFVPGGERQIRDMYALRELRPRGEIAARLLLVIAPAEELFWRGVVQAAFMRALGRWRGTAAATASYAGAHAVTGNFTLVGAAGVAGAHWSALYALGMPMGALIVSHAAWDIWIFLVQPTTGVGSAA
jgi:CAAX protease family protein